MSRPFATLVALAFPFVACSQTNPAADGGADSGASVLGFTPSNIASAIAGVDTTKLVDIDATSASTIKLECGIQPNGGCAALTATQPDGTQIDVYFARSWRIEQNAVVTAGDSKPIAIVALTTIDIVGRVDGSAQNIGTDAGGFAGTTTSGSGKGGGTVGKSTNGTSGIGGGGGAFCGAGGAGGNAGGGIRHGGHTVRQPAARPAGARVGGRRRGDVRRSERRRDPARRGDLDHRRTERRDLGRRRRRRSGRRALGGPGGRRRRQRRRAAPRSADRLDRRNARSQRRRWRRRRSGQPIRRGRDAERAARRRRNHGHARRRRKRRRRSERSGRRRRPRRRDDRRKQYGGRRRRRRGVHPHQHHVRLRRDLGHGVARRDHDVHDSRTARTLKRGSRRAPYSTRRRATFDRSPNRRDERGEPPASSPLASLDRYML